MSLEKSSKIHGSFRRLPALSQYFPIKEIKDSTIDIQATCRLTNLCLKQMAEKPDRASEDCHHNSNHFMARSIFSLFAEDVGSFDGSGLLNKTVDRMSETTSTDAHEVIYDNRPVQEWAKDAQSDGAIPGKIKDQRKGGSLLKAGNFV